MSDPTTTPTTGRRRHLMDPNAPRPTPSGSMSLGQVQKWVLSALAATTILHLSAGLVIAAIFIDEARVDGRVGLNVIAAAFGVIAVAVARAIHQKSLASPWLLLGLLPGLVGLWLTFR